MGASGSALPAYIAVGHRYPVVAEISGQAAPGFPIAESLRPVVLVPDLGEQLAKGVRATVPDAQHLAGPGHRVLGFLCPAAAPAKAVSTVCRGALFEIAKEIIEVSKKNKLPIYLETAMERNMKVYSRYGYEVYHYWEEEEKDIRFWFMKKDYLTS